MPQNKLGGNKAKRGRNAPKARKDLLMPDHAKDTHVAHVLKVLGDRRFEVEILTNKSKSKTIHCRLPTRMKKSGRVVVGTHVLINSSIDNVEIDYVYTPDDVIHLVNTEEIIDINMGGEDGNETGFLWGNLGTSEEVVIDKDGNIDTSAI